MSAYNIELPGVVLAGLYKKTIVQGEGKAVLEGGRPAVVEEKPATVVAPTVEAQQPVAPAMSASAATPTPAPVALVTPMPAPVTAAAAPLEIPATPQPAAAAPPPAAGHLYKMLGNNRQQVAVVVRCPGEAFLPEHHLQMLTKMLGACKLNLGDVAIINDAAQRVDIQILKEQLTPRRVLLFGVKPEEAGLPLSFPLFKDQEYAGTTYLYTPSLDELNTETDDGKLLKRRLWDSLKKIFGV
ncbi:hypothetical protein [Paraflavitalea pollutisoli]|uniref:hypothetical protein n=1 Tax=Paraflavitalea pollutisoli TaxID=3034143 RepID=UPI0023ED6C06|nr:hypothetical protein [Paraflavitalea sp. H1-2-19X]